MRYEEFDELPRLRKENRYLYEQVRSLSAALNDQRAAEWIILKGDERSTRPDHKTAVSRALVTDEVIRDAVINAVAHTVDDCMLKIEALPDAGEPLDHIWRFIVERDYVA